MNTEERSHRRAVWLIVGLLLASVAGFVGYELNWIHQRRAFLAEPESVIDVEWDREQPVIGSSGEWELPSTMAATPWPSDSSITNLSPLGSTVPQRLLQWLGEPPLADILVLYCPVDVDGGGTLAMPIAVDEIPKVSLVRRLFPEASVMVVLFAHGKR